MTNIMVNYNVIFNENASSSVARFYRKIYQVNIVALMIVASCTLCLLYLWIHYYLEIQNKHRILEIFNCIKMNFDQYRLSKLNETRLLWLTWIMQKLFIEQQVKFISIMVSALSTYACIMIIYEEIERNQNPFTIMLTILFGINIMILARLLLNIGLFSCALFILSIFYLILRFHEFHFKLIWTSKKRNWTMLNNLVVRHYHLCHLVSQLSPFTNYIIGCIYYFGTLLMVILIKVFINEHACTQIRIIAAILFSFLFIICYIINLIAASIPIYNRIISKYLYQFNFNEKLSGKNIINVKCKLKLDQFIATVNNVYIGFYCFNLFKFTKLSFYHFIFGISISVILFYKIETIYRKRA